MELGAKVSHYYALSNTSLIIVLGGSLLHIWLGTTSLLTYFYRHHGPKECHCSWVGPYFHMNTFLQSQPGLVFGNKVVQHSYIRNKQGKYAMRIF